MSQAGAMQVHLVDGTYELFRQFYGRNSGHTNAEGTEVGAVRGALRSTFALLNDGATHVGVATDHVIESFRNDLYEGYKTGEGIDPELFGQFGLFEDALRAAGFTVWAMVEQEADDALAAAAKVASADDRVERVVILTPDKDLGQCCAWPKVVQYDRRNQVFRDADGVREKFGVDPESIPDWLGPGRRHRRRLPRAARVGGQVGRRSAGPLQALGTHPRCPRQVGDQRAQRRQAGRHPGPTALRTPTCFARSPPCRPTQTSARSTTGAGAGPPPSWGTMRNCSTPPTCSEAPRR
jgi:hypothetical protein